MSQSHGHYVDERRCEFYDQQLRVLQAPLGDYYDDHSHFTSASPGAPYVASHPQIHSAPTPFTSSLRPQPMLMTDIPYAARPSIWEPESANTQLSTASPYSPFPQTLAASAYESDPLGGSIYQRSPCDYPSTPGEGHTDLNHFNYHAHPAVNTYDNSGFLMIGPESSSPTTSDSVVKKTVASPKVKGRADSKRKAGAKFNCSFCSADFTTKHNLHFHENSHKGMKPYQCDYCGSQFTVPRSKDRHQRNCRSCMVRR